MEENRDLNEEIIDETEGTAESAEEVTEEVNEAENNEENDLALVKKLKEEKNAIILAHYYVDEEVQKIADYIGDSFYLAKVASQTEADRIVFTVEHFKFIALVQLVSQVTGESLSRAGDYFSFYGLGTWKIIITQ